MSFQRPLVTVVMPVYNAGRYLDDAVLSIVNQSYKNWELLVLDDGSGDEAVDRLELYQDTRIKIFKGTETLGIAVRLNQGIEAAQGLFLARMDADDVSFPERLTRQVEMLEEDVELDLVGVRAITINEDSRITGLFPQALSHNAICARPWQGFHLAHPTWMGRITWFRANQYAIPAPYSCEDQELLLRTFQRSKFGCVSDVLFAYRVRTHVDWEKISRTRRAVLAFQWAQFHSAKNWMFAGLSVAGYMLRSMRDLWMHLTGRSYFPGEAVLPSTDILSEWSQVLKRLRM